MVRTLRTLKCNKKEEIVNPPQPSGTEAQLLEAEFQQGQDHVISTGHQTMNLELNFNDCYRYVF